MSGAHRLVLGGEFGASGFESGVRLEAREDVGHAMKAARDHCRGEVMRAGDDVGDEFGFDGIWDGRLKDADDGCGARALEAAKANDFADDGRIGVKRARPEFVSEDSHALRLGAIVGGTDEAAEDRLETDDVEVGAVDDSGGECPCFAEASYGEVESRKSADGLNGFEIGADVFDFRNGEGDVGGISGNLADEKEAGFVAIDERAEQNAADDAEDGGVGADAEGERDDGDDGEAGVFVQHAKREADVVEEMFEPGEGALVAVVFLHGFDAAEFEHGLAAGFDGVEAGAEVFFGGHGDVFGDFFTEARLAVGACVHGAGGGV